MDIRSLLGGMDRETLQRINKMMNTPEGRALMTRIKGMDKAEIMNEAKKAGLENVSREELVRRLSENPQLIRQLNQFLDRK